MTAAVEADLDPRPYGETSGWSGSEASKDRALREDATGITSQRQINVLRFVTSAGLPGVTWVDVAQAFSMHHGQASGVLSQLHKLGAISRLVERPGASSLYVSNEFVSGRPTSPQGRHKECPNCGVAL